MAIFNKRITWTDEKGNWGVEGVELGSLPPKIYGCLYKLKDLEDMIQKLNDPSTMDWEAESLTKELMAAAPFEREPTRVTYDGGVRRVC